MRGARRRVFDTSAASGPGHLTATIRQDRLAACPSGPPSSLCGIAAPSIVVFGQVKETGAAFPISYERGERSMNYDPELAALFSQPLSEGACRGYVISAMEVSCIP